jgi:hypothetical protein
MPSPAPSERALTGWRRLARRTRSPLFVAIAMGAGTINASVSIVFDHSDEGTSALTLPAFVIGLIFATALATRRTGP